MVIGRVFLIAKMINNKKTLLESAIEYKVE